MTVLAEFAASWSLFVESYLVGMISAVLLALLGVWVVGRRQVFLGAAIAQASGCGVAIALALPPVVGVVGDGMQALVRLLAATSGVVVGVLHKRPADGFVLGGRGPVESGPGLALGGEAVYELGRLDKPQDGQVGSQYVGREASDHLFRKL